MVVGLPRTEALVILKVIVNFEKWGGCCGRQGGNCPVDQTRNDPLQLSTKGFKKRELLSKRCNTI